MERETSRNGKRKGRVNVSFLSVFLFVSDHAILSLSVSLSDYAVSVFTLLYSFHNLLIATRWEK
jgi:hypothetical protein